MSSVLTIDGVPYAVADRVVANLILDRWSWSFEGCDSLEFHETFTGLPGSLHCGQSVSWSDDSVTYFSGQIVAVTEAQMGGAWQPSYRCFGLKYLANQVPVTASDFTGTMTFNNALDDEDYIASNSGKSCGDIVAAVLTQHSTALGDIGITTDGTTATQLAALTVVPPETVYISGERLWNTLEQFVSQWARNVHLYILPTGDGTGVIRVYDTTDLDELVLTMGTDVVIPPQLGRDITDCATRVVIRGGAYIESAYVSVLHETLTPAWDGTAQSDWTWADFTTPVDAYSEGAVTSVLSSTTVRINPTDDTVAWPENFWSDRQAWIHVISTVGTGLSYQESRPVTANTALTAGGTSDLTLAAPLQNAGSSAYDKYVLIGTVGTLADGGRNDVWRLYNVTDPGGLVADHLVKKFPIPRPFVNYTGNNVGMTNFPEAIVIAPLFQIPASFDVIPTTGQIRFHEPVVKALNSLGVLQTGGDDVVGPDDVYAILAYSRGALSAVYPPDVAGDPQYAGTAFTVDGLERSLYVDIPAWVYAGNQSLIDDYAAMIHTSVCDSVVEGDVTYLGKLVDVMTPGKTLSIEGAGYSSGWYDGLAAPVHGATLSWNDQSMNFITSIRISSRRNPKTGDRLYIHPTQLGGGGFFLGDPGLNGFAGMPLGSAALGQAMGEIGNAEADMLGGASADKYGLKFATPGVDKAPKAWGKYTAWKKPGAMRQRDVEASEAYAEAKAAKEAREARDAAQDKADADAESQE